MNVRRPASRKGSRRLTSRRFPAPVRKRESAFTWLSSDPVFAGSAAAARS